MTDKDTRRSNRLQEKPRKFYSDRPKSVKTNYYSSKSDKNKNVENDDKKLNVENDDKSLSVENDESTKTDIAIVENDEKLNVENDESIKKDTAIAKTDDNVEKLEDQNLEKVLVSAKGLGEIEEENLEGGENLAPDEVEHPAEEAQENLLEEYQENMPDNQPAEPNLSNNLALGICLKPNSFSGDVNLAADWLKRFENYAELLKLTNEAKARTMGLLMEGDGGVWYNGLTTEEKNNWNTLQEKFKTHFKENTEQVFERRMGLASRTQMMGEDVENYLKDICKQMTGLEMDDQTRMAQVVNGLEPSMKMRVLEFMPFADLQALKNKIRQLNLSRKVLGNQIQSTAAQKTKETEEGTSLLSELQNINKTLNDMKRHPNNANYRGRGGNYGQRSRWRGRSNYSSYSNRPRRQCYRCGSESHLIARCPQASRSPSPGSYSPRFQRRNSFNRGYGQRRVQFNDRRNRYISPRRNEGRNEEQSNLN